MIIVPDTSVLIDGRVSELIKTKKIACEKIIIPVPAIAELERQANRGKETGFSGLEEIKKIKTLVNVDYLGERPNSSQIRRAKSGEIDAMIRKIAKEYNATLLTSDAVQSRVADAEGISVIYFEPQLEEVLPSFMKYFDNETLSIHLKEGAPAYAKKGKPGKFLLHELTKEKITKENLEKMIWEVMTLAKRKKETFIELDKGGATVIQMGSYRIAIARPPFSDGLEITVVRPITRCNLEDYKLSNELLQRFNEKAEGIIVAGPPGSGKSTFCAALAEYYKSMGKVVKTLESPKDLQVSDEITQYGPLDGSFENTADILLLVRPDYTFYDEMRKTIDFKIFADLRLAGVGMIGVVHATKPIDAVQRFIGRIELGMIPEVVDTIVFIKNGFVEKVYELRFNVKVPAGMREQDLARPVIEVLDFDGKRPEYEIYTFGEETVVLPVKKSVEKGKISNAMMGKIHSMIAQYAFNDFEIKVEDGTVYVKAHPEDVGHILGKKGKNAAKIEKKMKMKLEVSSY